MKTERTQVDKELEAALGKVLAHVRGEVELPCRIVDTTVDDPSAEHILALRKRMKLVVNSSQTASFTMRVPYRIGNRGAVLRIARIAFADRY